MREGLSLILLFYTSFYLNALIECLLNKYATYIFLM